MSAVAVFTFLLELHSHFIRMTCELVLIEWIQTRDRKRNKNSRRFKYRLPLCPNSYNLSCKSLQWLSVPRTVTIYNAAQNCQYCLKWREVLLVNYYLSSIFASFYCLVIVVASRSQPMLSSGSLRWVFVSCSFSAVHYVRVLTSGEFERNAASAKTRPQCDISTKHNTLHQLTC